MNVSWSPPETPNGVLTQYRILANDTSRTNSSLVVTTVTDTGVLSQILSGLRPFTTYEIKIAASTIGGSKVGPGQGIKTKEAGIP